MPGQQIVDIAHPMSACQTRENACEPGLWIDDRRILTAPTPLPWGRSSLAIAQKKPPFVLPRPGSRTGVLGSTGLCGATGATVPSNAMNNLADPFQSSVSRS